MSRGMDGFGEDAGADFSLTLGSVLGVRWFWLKAPDFYKESPLQVEGYPPPWKGQPPRLTGSSHHVYQDGVAEASCNDARTFSGGVGSPNTVTAGGGGGSSGIPPWTFAGGGAAGSASAVTAAGTYESGNQAQHKVPHPPCGCGFWAYWTTDAAGKHPLGGTSQLAVLGVVEGTGRVIHGDKGFRAQKCRIVALHAPVKISARKPVPPPSPEAVRLRGQRDVLWHQLQNLVSASSKPGAAPQYPKFAMLLGELEAMDARVAEAEKPDKEREERYARASADWSLAWQAAIECSLTMHYPSARIYSNPDAMLRSHPPGKGYLFE